MKGRKILKIVGVVILVIIVLFLIYSFRNYSIISKLQKEVAKYENSNNFHIHMETKQNDQISLISDYYKKDNKQVTILERSNEDGETTKISFYNKRQIYFKITFK